MDEIIRRALLEQVGVSGFGGSVFCSYELLGQEEKATGIYAYVWTVCQEYYRQGDTIQRGTGSSLPVSLQLHKDGDGYRVLKSKTPGDGENYGADIRMMFPADVLESIFFSTSAADEVGRNEHLRSLEMENEEAARSVLNAP